MRTVRLFCILFALSMVCGCASVRVTKTAKGYFTKTNPSDVEILVTIPQREFVELATVTTQNWSTSKTAKMHNSLRAKCAPLGASAVILGSSGIDYNGDFWASGVAIRYKDTIQDKNTASDPGAKCQHIGDDSREFRMVNGELMCTECYDKMEASKGTKKTGSRVR